MAKREEEMDDKLTYQVQRWTAWTGPVMVVTYLAFWIILGHNHPPPSSGLTGAQLVADYYGSHRDDILLGMSLCAFSGILYLPWTVLLTVQMWRREKVPVLSLMQLTGGTLTAWLLAMCPAMWAWCARYATTPGVDPELVKSVHMVSWYIYDMTYMVTTVQLFGCGVFALLDRKLPAIFPRWAGWVAIWTGVCFLPLTLIPYFEDGPVALNGWWNFYVAFASWGVWFCSYSYFMFKDVKRLSVAPAPAIGQAMSYGHAE
jgi:hypothetical protein